MVRARARARALPRPRAADARGGCEGQIPKAVSFAEIPKTSTGKVQKFKVRSACPKTAHPPTHPEAQTHTAHPAASNLLRHTVSATAGGGAPRAGGARARGDAWRGRQMREMAREVPLVR